MSGSNVGPSLAASSANTSEPPKSPGQGRWRSSRTPQGCPYRVALRVTANRETRPIRIAACRSRTYFATNWALPAPDVCYLGAGLVRRYAVRPFPDPCIRSSYVGSPGPGPVSAGREPALGDTGGGPE